jgi:5-(aminomethyl)-3-furanmethanol phosphate kinase
VGLVIAKVGGSLYGLSDLADRLRTWVAAAGRDVLFVPGGGDGADVIRRLDETHRIGAGPAHWLALRVLTVNAHFLAGLLAAPVVPFPDPAGPPIRVLDPFAFCRADEGGAGALPHTWGVTSDAVAARAAEVVSARLVVLKSTDLPTGMDWTQAAVAGFVDETFPRVVARAGLRVGWVNLRSPGWPGGSPLEGGEPGRR